MMSRIKDSLDFNKGCDLVHHRFFYPQEPGTAYCAGVGGNVEYEKMLESLGYEVVYLDPSPVGVETAMTLGLTNFHPVGLAAETGMLDFGYPDDPEEKSYKLGYGKVFPCTTLGRLMAERGNETIELLKLNIEGFEYQVLGYVLSHGLRIRQICVSFHDRIQGLPGARTLRCVYRLLRVGYRPVGKKRSAWTFVFKRS